MQSTTLAQLTPAAAQAILENLPERIRLAFIDRASEINYPIEAVIKMALAGYLDSESITSGRSKTNGFVD
jgi:flagellar motor switch protein FliG